MSGPEELVGTWGLQRHRHLAQGDVEGLIWHQLRRIPRCGIRSGFSSKAVVENPLYKHTLTETFPPLVPFAAWSGASPEHAEGIITL